MSRIAAAARAAGAEHWNHRLRRSLQEVCGNYGGAGRNHQHRNGSAKSGSPRTGNDCRNHSRSFSAKNVINCAGLHSDRVSRMAGQKPEVRIVPFRGEYYDLVPERAHLVRTLIYPVPDPKFPFLGVHFTRRIQGGVDAGPNAVLALKREGYKRTDFNLRDFAGTMTYPGFWHMAGKYWRDGFREYYRSLSKRAFVKALQQLVPEIVSSDLVADGSGVRAQAVRPDGSMVDDFHFVQSDKMLHVWNVPSPAATASLPIGRHIAEMASKASDRLHSWLMDRTKSAVLCVQPTSVACHARPQNGTIR